MNPFLLRFRTLRHYLTWYQFLKKKTGNWLEKNWSERCYNKWTIYYKLKTNPQVLSSISIRDREPSRIPIRIIERLKNKSRKVRMFVYESIRLTIPKSSKLYCYVKARKQKKKQTLHLNALTNWIIILNVDFVSIYHCLHVINWQRLGDMQQIIVNLNWVEI